MAAFRRSMSSVNASMLAIFVCGVIGTAFYTLLQHAYGVDENQATYDEPIEEQFVVSDTFMGGPAKKMDEGKAAVLPPWSYSGSTAPASWGSLGERYAACGTGKQQSPIDIVRPQLSSKLLPLRFHYREAEVTLKNLGHGLEVNYESGSYLEIDGLRYDLVSIDFHSPSEHLIDGIPYDMEVHLRHKNSQGQEAVVAILVEEGTKHAALASLWGYIPERAGDMGDTVNFNASAFLPKVRTYYSYRGSMTTPPCDEGVHWLVMTRPIAFSETQVDRFLAVVRYNARPTQALGGRSILRSRR